MKLDFLKRIGDKEIIIDKQTKQTFLTWGITMVLFFVIAITCISFIFAPVEEGNDNYVSISGVTTMYGLELRGESWSRYPNYVIGLGAAAVLSFGGALFSAYNIYKVKEVE